MTSASEPLIAEVKEAFGRVAYTHKTHEKDAERCDRSARRIKILSVAIIGITAGAALAAPLLDSRPAAWVAAASAIIGLVFAAYQLAFDPSAEASRHRLAAKSFLTVRDQYRRLLTDAQAGDVSPKILRERRDQLARELDHLHRTAHQTSPKAYKNARAALRGSEELTFSDTEYRHLLGPDQS